MIGLELAAGPALAMFAAASTRAPSTAARPSVGFAFGRGPIGEPSPRSHRPRTPYVGARDVPEPTQRWRTLLKRVQYSRLGYLARTIVCALVLWATTVWATSAATVKRWRTGVDPNEAELVDASELRVASTGGLEVQFRTTADGVYQAWRCLTPKAGSKRASIVFVADTPVRDGLPAAALPFLTAGFEVYVPLVGGSAGRPTVDDTISAVGSVVRDLHRLAAETVTVTVGGPSSRSSLIGARRNSASDLLRPIYVVGIGLGGLVALSYAARSHAHNRCPSITSWQAPSRENTGLRNIGARAKRRIASVSKPRQVVAATSGTIDLPVVAGVIALSPLVDSKKAETGLMGSYRRRSTDIEAARLSASPLAHASTDIKAAIDELTTNACDIRTPVLLVHCTKDPFTTTGAITALHGSIGAPDRCLILCPGLPHLALAPSDSMAFRGASRAALLWLRGRQPGSPSSRTVRFAEPQVRVGGPTFECEMDDEAWDEEMAASDEPATDADIGLIILAEGDERATEEDEDEEDEPTIYPDETFETAVGSPMAGRSSPLMSIPELVIDSGAPSPNPYDSESSLPSTPTLIVTGPPTPELAARRAISLPLSLEVSAAASAAAPGVVVRKRLSPPTDALLGIVEIPHGELDLGLGLDIDFDSIQVG